jgi:hypothetical protein
MYGIKHKLQWVMLCFMVHNGGAVFGIRLMLHDGGAVSAVCSHLLSHPFVTVCIPVQYTLVLYMSGILVARKFKDTLQKQEQ